MSKIAVIMGSKSDYKTMKECCSVLDKFGIDYDKKVVSAHRTPELMVDFAKMLGIMATASLLLQLVVRHICQVWLLHRLLYQ